MKIAVTGGSGFIGGRLAQALIEEGHEVVLITRPKSGGTGDSPDGGRGQLVPLSSSLSSFAPVGLENAEKLAAALAGCDAVAHCAGINREIGTQTYANVHIAGTRNVVVAARKAAVRKIVFVSFLRARPGCGSPYHESKWAGEEIIRNSGLDYTIIKPGVIYGRGDHMLDHLSHAFYTFPVFGLVGIKDQMVRPAAVEDIVRILRAALVEGRLARETVAVTGPEALTLRQAVERVAGVLRKRPLMMRLPLFFHYALGWLLERLMRTPLVSLAQVRILSEGVVEPAPPCPFVPEDLAPRLAFTEEQIRRGLPEPGGFGLSDLRAFNSRKAKK